MERVFQQDNAPCHKSKSVMKYITNKKITLLDHPYPPQSPDLNPIENLWNHVKRQIHKNHTISGVEDIWSGVLSRKRKNRKE